MIAPVELESSPCPMGCAAADEPVLTARDRLHDLPGTYRVVQCTRCGLLRTDPRPTREAIGFYYPDTYRPFHTSGVTAAPPAGQPAGQPAAGPAAARQRLVSWLFDFRNQRVPPLSPGRLLEVGCGAGGFLRRMAAQGWSVTGVEPHEGAARAARDLGYAVHAGPIETAPDPSAPFDLIVGWMVLEHLHAPVAALEKLRRWAHPGGWLALSVPDAGALEFRLFGDAWYALQVPSHLYHYTPRTLERLLERGGWRVERIFWHDNPSNFLQSLRYRCLERGWHRAGDALREAAEGRTHPYLRAIVGKVMGRLRASGRMTVWARPA